MNEIGISTIPADEQTMQRLAHAVRELQGAEGPVIVGIDGPGASGKSTIAKKLSSLVGGFVVHGDDFYLPSSSRPDRGAYGFRYDLQRLQRQVLLPAQQGLPVRFDVYDWSQDEIGSQAVVPGNPPIIVEGVYTTRNDLAEFYDYRILVWARREVRLNRGLSRDGEAARTKWTEEWMPAEDTYFEGDRPQDRAHMVIRT